MAKFGITHTDIQTRGLASMTPPPQSCKPRSGNLLFKFPLLHLIVRINLTLHGFDLARPFREACLWLWQIDGP